MAATLKTVCPLCREDYRVPKDVLRKYTQQHPWTCHTCRTSPVTVAAKMVEDKGTGTATDDGYRATGATWKPGPNVTWVGKTCTHTGSVPVFSLSNGKRIYGARASSLSSASTLAHLDLILDCSGQVKPRRFVTGGRRWGFLNKLAVGPEVVTLNWPDMTAPTHVRLAFWESLIKALPDHTCVSCVGSHGRTGTAMACLLVADGMDAVGAIATVREKHCKHAIETAAQEAYVKSIETERNERKG